MYKLFTMSAIIFLFAVSSFAQNVTVNPGAGSYPTLKAAFDAINAGTHTGTVTVSITANTTEPVTAELNASGTGSANYVSVFISPSTPVTVTGSDTAVIRLIGADNVTIDGRIGGTGRNLTITNTLSVYNSSAVWISMGATIADSTGAQNNTVRNCEISTGVRVDLTEDNSYGIIISGATYGFSAGRNNDNNQILNNRFIRCRYGVLLQGGVTNSRSKENQIIGNIIGPDAAGSDNIGKAGIYSQFQDNCTISNNLIQNVGGTFAGTVGGSDRVGIGAGSEQWASTPTATGNNNYVITNNIVHGIKEERTFSAVGILCATALSGVPTNNLIANNEVYDVLANGTGSNSAIGIGISGNNTYDIVAFNSIYMVGDMDPPGTTTATQVACGMRLAIAIDSNNTIINNSIYVDLNSDNASLKKCCIQMPTANYVFSNEGMNYNNYYYPAANTQMALGAIGATSSPIGFFQTLASWKTVFIPVNQDANSKFGDPLYSLSSPNYLFPLNSSSSLVSGGTPVTGITTDLLGNTRSSTNPTIGSYEFNMWTFTLTASIEAMTVFSVGDTISLILRNTSSPYIVKDISTAFLNGSGNAVFNIQNTPPGNYYVVFNHRNALETWSATGVADSSYDFTTSLSKAFGNNMISVGGEASFYSGDVNKDNVIDLTDGSDIDNDASNFISGYVRTDVNNDLVVDLTDASYSDNNAYNFVAVVAP